MYTPSTAEIDVCSFGCMFAVTHKPICVHTLSLSLSLSHTAFWNNKWGLCISDVHVSHSFFSSQPVFSKSPWPMSVGLLSQPWEVLKPDIIHAVPSLPGHFETPRLRDGSLRLLMPCSLGNHSLLGIVLLHNAPLILVIAVSLFFICFTSSVKTYLPSRMCHPSRKTATETNEGEKDKCSG